MYVEYYDAEGYPPPPPPRTPPEQTTAATETDVVNITGEDEEGIMEMASLRGTGMPQTETHEPRADVLEGQSGRKTSQKRGTPKKIRIHNGRSEER